MTDERFEALNDAVQEILRKQASLEARLSRLEAALPGVAGTAPAPSVPSPPFEEVRQAPPTIHPEQGPVAIKRRPASTAASERPAIETKVGLTLVNRIGVITLVMGV